MRKDQEGFEGSARDVEEQILSMAERSHANLRLLVGRLSEPETERLGKIVSHSAGLLTDFWLSSSPGKKELLRSRPLIEMLVCLQTAVELGHVTSVPSETIQMQAGELVVTESGREAFRQLVGSCVNEWRHGESGPRVGESS